MAVWWMHERRQAGRPIRRHPLASAVTADPGDYRGAAGMSRLFRFELHDGTGGSVIYPEPVALETVTADCHARFGIERVKGVSCG
ncbi:hypothetical protein YSKK_13510 [Halopseudomonas aestusnigri]|nr:hypothetical protein YSKK_13510 [Halopseudomonas aestusnigri]